MIQALSHTGCATMLINQNCVFVLLGLAMHVSDFVFASLLNCAEKHFVHVAEGLDVLCMLQKAWMVGATMLLQQQTMWLL